MHQSEFCQTNAVVVHGRAGVLLIDPGVYGSEMACLANDLDAGQPVVAGFSTHPHWDHVLWHARLGSAPRYGTARCAAAVREATVGCGREGPRIAQMDAAGHRRADVDWDLFGLVTGLPAEHRADSLGRPAVRIIEHQAHAPGHAALLIEERGVLVAGDMLSDVLIPLLDLSDTVTRSRTTSPRCGCSRAWRATLTSSFRAMAPSEGLTSCANGSNRIARTCRHCAAPCARRPAGRHGAKEGCDWVADVHARQLRGLAEETGATGRPVRDPLATRRS